MKQSPFHHTFRTAHVTSFLPIRRIECPCGKVMHLIPPTTRQGRVIRCANGRCDQRHHVLFEGPLQEPRPEQSRWYGRGLYDAIYTPPGVPARLLQYVQSRLQEPC